MSHHLQPVSDLQARLDEQLDQPPGGGTYDAFDDGCYHHPGDVDHAGRVVLESFDLPAELVSALAASRAEHAASIAALADASAAQPLRLRTPLRHSIWLQFGSVGEFSLFVDEFGDSLYARRQAAPAGIFCVFHARDFSLARHDLGTERGRRAAREYVRRRLKSLAALSPL